MIQRFQPLGGIKNNVQEWFNEGIECRILKPHQGWIKGKIRINISLEFCPDEPESQLDDIRQKL